MPHRLQDVVQAQLGARYRVEREIGHGGMGRVFLATDVLLGRAVAVKVLRPELASRVSAERFRQEVQLTLELQHPHVLPVLDAGGTDDPRLDALRYYITPYVEGETLRQRLVLGGRLPVPEALRLLGEAADAVAYAHAHGVAHRDVKPENVLLAAGHAVLADFGVARAVAVDDAERLTGSETIVGTRGYLPPDERPASAADVYALGVVGYEMLAGRRPDCPPDDPRWREALPAALPDAVAAVLAAALRPGDAIDAAGLRDAVAGRGVGAAPGARAPTGVGGANRNTLARRRGATLGATLAIVGIVAAVAAYVRPRDPALDAHLVAVAPWRVSDGALAPWREDMVEWVYRNLDGAGALRAVPTARALRLWSADADDPVRAFGRETGARYVIGGSLVPLGTDSVRVAATLTDAADGERVDDFELRVSVAQLNHAPDSVTLWVLRGLNRVLPVGAVRTRDAAFGARSIPALKAFFRGEAEYRANRWDDARAHYERALTLDPTFALAMRRMRGVLRVHDELDPRSLDFALRAGQANRGLGPRDSMLVAADSVLAAVMAEPVHSPTWWRLVRRRFALLDSLVQRDPADAEALHELGEALYHHGDYVGRDEREVASVFRRGIEQAPEFAPSYFHAFETTLRLDGRARADSLVTAYLRSNPGDSGFRLVRAMVRAPDPARVVLDGIPPVHVTRAAFMLHRWPDSRESALLLYRHLARAVQQGPEAEHSRLHYFLALTFRGRLRAAADIGRPELVREHVATAVQLGIHGALAPDEMQRLVEVWRTDGPTSLLPALPWLLHEGDTLSIRELARTCEARAPGCRDAYGALVSAAYLALARRDTATALKWFAGLPDSLCVRECSADRLLHARLLMAVGRAGDAARVLDRYPPTPSRLGVHEGLRLALRERVAGVEADLASAEALWIHADEPLRALVRRQDE